MSDKKHEVAKVFRILLVVFVVLLVGLGIVCVNMTKRNTQEKQLQADEEFMGQIRDDTEDSLTDEQFDEGLKRILPTDTTTLDEYTAKYKVLSNALKDKEVYYVITRIDYFGTCACLLEITGEITLDELKSFVPEAGFSRVYIHVLSAVSRLIQKEYLCDGQEVTETFSGDRKLGDSITNDRVSVMFKALCDEYNLTDSDITFTGDVMRVSFKTISDANAVDIFDYLYRWCRQEKINTVIQMFKGKELYALASVDIADTRFEEYYPSVDLAAQYRLRFYIMCDYLRGAPLSSAIKLII